MRSNIQFLIIVRIPNKSSFFLLDLLPDSLSISMIFLQAPYSLYKWCIFLLYFLETSNPY